MDMRFRVHWRASANAVEPWQCGFIAVTNGSSCVMSANQERVLAHTLGRELSMSEIRAVAGAGTSTALHGEGEEKACDNDNEEWVECEEVK